MSLRTKQMRVDDLIEHPRNARHGNVERIMDSLSVHGQYKALVVQAATNHVLAGNHTLKAARRLGWATISCHVLDISDEQALRILLVDNKTSDEADYDYEQLADILDDLNTTGGLDGTGWTGDELDRLLTARPQDNDPDRNTRSRPTVSEAKDAYDESPVRAIVLAYPGNEWEWVTARLAESGARHGTGSNADTIDRLLQAYA